MRNSGSPKHGDADGNVVGDRSTYDSQARALRREAEEAHLPAGRQVTWLTRARVIPSRFGDGRLAGREEGLPLAPRLRVRATHARGRYGDVDDTEPDLEFACRFARTIFALDDSLTLL